VRAVVTGASRGIGRATVLALAERGVELALPGRHSQELADTARLAQVKGSRVRVFECDLLEAGQIHRAAREILSELGTLDILVNNAGIIRRSAVERTTTESWDEQIAVNLRAPFLLTRELLPAMRAARRGRILHVASISATLGSPEAAAYVASKWGLVGFMKSLAEELHDSGLMTLAVLPGSVDTAMLAGSGYEPRMSAEDVARTLVHYALDASLAHNGSIIEMFGT
jgi:3-oxoacyl-[acyl-carrier protein] reductase